MATLLRSALSASALIAAALLVAGCTSAPGSSTPTSTSTPGGSDSSTTPDDNDDFEATWLDDGRLFAVVTWGSSTCVPTVDTVTAEGQTVTVALVDTDAEAICTKDLAPRASIGGLPEGVDPTKDVELIVTLGDVTEDVDLDGNAALTGTPGSSTEYLPSAGWFDDEGVVLLTWGSSTCVPVVEGIEEQGNAVTVTFATDDDQVCTMDMAPRATILAFSDDIDDDALTLTLVGGNLDATVPVL